VAATLPKTTQPRWFCGISFTDPNDPSAVKVWKDFTSVLRGVNNIQRGGAVYELGQSVAGQPKFYLRDVNEDLNPDNPSSAYAGNILPYRPISWMGTWPQVAGNLLNTGAWRVPFDPSFEASTVGAQPAWISVLGGTTPVVGTTTPRTGSRDLTWTTAAVATIQGVGIGPALTMPGTQYTASAYVRQSTASTQAIAVGGLAVGVDAFNRTVANGWGTADVGGAWTATGGAASDFAVVPGTLSARGTGSHTLTSVNVARMTTVGVNAVDADVTAIVSSPALAVGAAIRQGLVLRWTAATDFYRASVDFNTDSTMTLTVWKRVAGTETSLGTTTLASTYTAGAQFGLRFRATGTTLQAWCWPVATNRPASASVTVTGESSITAAGQVGCWSRLETGNTNGTTTLPYRYFNATGTILGSTTTATGAYNRVTVTFTATDISHTLYVRTVGTALAGTTLLDDVQMEEGASASTFTQTGPVVYPVFNGTCERYERTWPSSGFEGEALITAVDNLAALNAISIGTEYAVAIEATNPDFVWPLDDGAADTSFIDRSGNGGPSLVLYPSKNGAGTAPSPGSSLGIVGDPGGTGVAFSWPGLAQNTGTVLGYGAVINRGQSLIFPNYGPSSWAATMACWVVCTSTGDAQVLVLPVTNNTTTTLPAEGMSLAIDGIHNKFDPFLSGATGTVDLFNAGPVVTDGKPHLLVATAVQVAGGNSTLTGYVDGVQIATSTVTTASLGGIATIKPTSLVVGGYFAHTAYEQIVNGSMAWVALWNRVLTSSEITNLWTAGGLGDSGELAGVRVARHLGSSVGSYAGPTRISFGSSVMGPPSYQGSIRLLPDTQNTVVAEGGCLWAAQDGAIVFEGRQDRWLRLTPVATFGENQAGGEIPYEPDFSLAQDPQYLFANVQITRANGSTAVGGRNADIIAATNRFFGKPYAATVDLLNDADVQSLADWTFYTHNRPLTRAAVLTITPARAVGTSLTTAGTWAQAFSLEIGQRVRATRRASAGNSGAGVTVTLDYFIEAVTYDDFNPDTGEFTARYLLSPVGAATSGTGVTFQPWILGDATLGVLGSTTVLGW